MAIGTFGSVTFEVSTEKTRTFAEFSRKTSAKFEEHAIISQKAKLEFISPGLDEISFQVVFSAFHGLNPLQEVNQIREIVQTGEYHPLLIGGKVIGIFIIETLSEAWKYVDNHGLVLHIAVDLTLKEYFLDEAEKRRITETAEAAAVQAEKAEQVAAATAAQAQQTGLSLQNISDLASMAINGVRDPSLAISGVEAILSATTALQGGSVSSAATASYTRLGLDVADLAMNSRMDPLGTAMEVLERVGNNTAVDKPATAKAIYGARAAGTVLQMARRVKEG